MTTTQRASAALVPWSVTVELRPGWPMHVGVVLANREIIWRAPIARSKPGDALDDAIEAVQLQVVRS